MNPGTRTATGKLTAGSDEMQKLLRRCPTPAGTLRSLLMDGKELERHCRHRFFPCRRRVELEQGTSPLSLSARSTRRRPSPLDSRIVIPASAGGRPRNSRRSSASTKQQAELGVHETTLFSDPPPPLLRNGRRRRQRKAHLSNLKWDNMVSGSLYGALIGSVLAYIIADFLGLLYNSFLISSGYACCSHVYCRNGTKSDTRNTYFFERVFHSLWDACKSYSLGYITGNIYVDLVGGWRYMYATCAPICIVMGIGMWCLPPSPRWLLLCAIQGKRSVQDARELSIKCLCRLRGSAFDSSASEQVDLILNDLSHADHGKQSTFREIFQGKCLKALIIGAGLVFFQQITGQPSVLYYAATILQSAGFSAASDATRVSILLGLLKVNFEYLTEKHSGKYSFCKVANNGGFCFLVQLIMTGIAVLVVDRLGRRPLLISGVSGITISLFLLSSYYTFLKDLPFVAVIALLVYVGCYQLSFGPIGWLMISEIFPLRLRGRGLSIAVLVNFASNALVTFAFSPLEMRIVTFPITAEVLLYHLDLCLVSYLTDILVRSGNS
ncbi:hypothetical protein ZIOFF_018875 [Zingiber officinale]|uniref:Sugar transporter n=1 Tax=Zingiber officinale TaxID=94328 RepID=A0A8J5H8V1_ZINOF|nr:hypothetical protein ZIOFF_018875 [Zingiber officinale]